MKDIECSREQSILRAAATGQLNDEMKAHLSSCSICSDAFAVARVLQRVAEDSANRHGLPAAGLIWWKAQLLEKRSAAETATRPITIIQTIASIVMALTLIVGLIWRWQQIGQLLIKVKSEWLYFFSSFDALPQLVLFIGLSVPLLSFLSIYIINTVLDKDGDQRLSN